MTSLESQLAKQLIDKRQWLKYAYRADICDRAAIEANFRQHFETLPVSSKFDFAMGQPAVILRPVCLAAISGRNGAT